MNMSQTSLAYRVDELLPEGRLIYQYDISRIESCKRELDWELVTALATVLGIDHRTAAIKARVLPCAVEELDTKSFAQTLNIVERINDGSDGINVL
jgi:hypothetical protein